MVEIADLNPFAKFDIGLGQIGNALLILAIVTVIFGLIGWLIYWRITSRQYKYKIPLYKSINGTNFLQGMYFAKIIPISKSGDSLWFVKGLKKFLAPATLTSAPNTFPHEEREDGEWINFSIDSVNDQQKKAGVKFIQQDMRTQRVATGQILEQRLINKGFWDKYKDMVIHLIFYIVVTLMLIVIFWQWSDIVTQIGGLVSKLESVAKTFDKLECVGVRDTGIIPAITLLLWRTKRWRL